MSDLYLAYNVVIPFLTQEAAESYLAEQEEAGWRGIIVDKDGKYVPEDIEDGAVYPCGRFMSQGVIHGSRSPLCSVCGWLPEEHNAEEIVR